MPGQLAYAIIRDDPPRVIVAESIDVLHRALALLEIAQTPVSHLGTGGAEALREALLDERWGDAVVQWIEATGLAVDVYDDLDVWTNETLSEETAGLELQFTPLFRD